VAIKATTAAAVIGGVKQVVAASAGGRGKGMGR